MSHFPQDRRIDYVEFTVPDVEAAKAFYQRVFGWQFTDYGPEYTSFFDGRLSGGFQQGPAKGPGGALVVLYARDLEAIEASVVAAGGRVVRPTFDFPGGRRFHFVDPCGQELATWSDQPPAK